MEGEIGQIVTQCPIVLVRIIYEYAKENCTQLFRRHRCAPLPQTIAVEFFPIEQVDEFLTFCERYALSVDDFDRPIYSSRYTLGLTLFHLAVTHGKLSLVKYMHERLKCQNLANVLLRIPQKGDLDPAVLNLMYLGYNSSGIAESVLSLSLMRSQRPHMAIFRTMCFLLQEASDLIELGKPSPLSRLLWDGVWLATLEPLSPSYCEDYDTAAIKIFVLLVSFGARLTVAEQEQHNNLTVRRFLKKVHALHPDCPLPFPLLLPR
jgi:hypothetical protein